MFRPARNPNPFTQPFVFTRGGGDYKQRVLALSPLAYWALDETSGSTAVDATGNGFDGTATAVTWGGETFVNGTPAPTFNGSTSIVLLPHAPLSAVFPYHSGSVMVWIHASSATMLDVTFRGIVQFNGTRIGGNYRCRLIKPGTFSNRTQMMRDPGGVYNYDPYVGGAWQTYLWTWNEATNSTLYYVDGVYGTETGAIGTSANALTLALLGANTATTSFWEGGIAHVAIFNYVLSAAQVTDLATV